MAYGAPTITRAAVLEALFVLLAGSSAYATTGRRLMHWGEVDTQPALFQRYTGEDTAPLIGYGQPQRTTMKVEVWIYNKTGSPYDTPEDAMTPLMDALDAALASGADFAGRQTLGLDGLVEHAWREGETILSQGELADQAILVANIHVLVVAGFAPA